MAEPFTGNQNLYPTFDTDTPDAVNTTLLTLQPGGRKKRAKRQSFLKVPKKVPSNFNRARPRVHYNADRLFSRILRKKSTFFENFAQDLTSL